MPYTSYVSLQIVSHTLHLQILWKYISFLHWIEKFRFQLKIQLLQEASMKHLKSSSNDQIHHCCRYFSFVAFIVSTYEQEFAQRIKSTSIDGLGTDSGISRCLLVLSTVLYCTVLCYDLICCAVLCCTVRTTLWCVVLYCTAQYLSRISLCLLPTTLFSPSSLNARLSSLRTHTPHTWTHTTHTNTQHTHTAAVAPISWMLWCNIYCGELEPLIPAALDSPSRCSELSLVSSQNINCQSPPLTSSPNLPSFLTFHLTQVTAGCYHYWWLFILTYLLSFLRLIVCAFFPIHPSIHPSIAHTSHHTALLHLLSIPLYPTSSPLLS